MSLPFGSMFPLPTPPRDDVAESAIVLHEEQRAGEVELDAVIRAQSSAPQVVKRFTALEDCLWKAAEALVKLSSEDRERIGADQIIERARILLNGDLEIPASARVTG
jgi:hypothetical protein